MIRFWRAAPVVAVLVSGCAYMQRLDKTQEVLDRPAPSSEARRSQDCARISTQIARESSVRDDKAAAVEDPFEHAKAKASAERNLASLRARQAELDCASAAAPAEPAPTPAAAPAAPAAPAAQKDEGFDRCFDRCRRYTDRSKEQCFDICNKPQ